MRAALINAFGEPTKVLELADVPEPSGPAPGVAEAAPGGNNHCGLS